MCLLYDWRISGTTTWSITKRADRLGDKPGQLALFISSIWLLNFGVEIAMLWIKQTIASEVNDNCFDTLQFWYTTNCSVAAQLSQFYILMCGREMNHQIGLRKRGYLLIISLVYQNLNIKRYWQKNNSQYILTIVKQD